MIAANPKYVRDAGGDLSWMRGAIGIAGPYDFLPMTDPKIITIFGGANDPATQPIIYVDGKRPPMLLVAGTADESIRYPAARAWAVSHGLPRHVFCRFTGEGKPIYADLTSLASIDLISRSLGRARREGGADATVTVVEMLPAPDQLWLTCAQGQRYTSELRLVAADQQAAVRQPTEEG